MNEIVYGKYKAIYYYGAWNSYAKNFQISDLPDCIENIVYGCWYINIDATINSTDIWIDVEKKFKKENYSVKSILDKNEQNLNYFGNFLELTKLKNQRPINIALLFNLYDIDIFRKVMSLNTLRIKLIYNIIDLFEKYKLLFNGIVFDYIYISENIYENDNNNFKLFLKELRDGLNKNGLNDINITLLMSGIPKYNINISILNKYIDRIYILTIHFNNESKHIAIHHSNPRKSNISKYSCEDSLEYYLKYFPSFKLYITSVFYSKGYSNTLGLGKEANGESIDSSWEKGKVDYNDLPLSGALEYFDYDSKAAYTYDINKKILNSYDNKLSIIEKCNIIKEKNLGGLFVYDIYGDKTILIEDKSILHPDSLILVIRENLTHIKPKRNISKKI